jgi:glucose/arabinose dehydrogenase
MAQPSGLSASVPSWLADSESSAVRWVSDGEMHTAVGQGLFDFGLVDGSAGSALFQHPLGVCALPDGSVLVADTYNGAVRLISSADDPGGRIVSTVETGLAEPSDIVVTPDSDVVVVESTAHRLTASRPARSQP